MFGLFYAVFACISGKVGPILQNTHRPTGPHPHRFFFGKALAHSYATELLQYSPVRSRRGGGGGSKDPPGAKGSIGYSRPTVNVHFFPNETPPPLGLRSTSPPPPNKTPFGNPWLRACNIILSRDFALLLDCFLTCYGHNIVWGLVLPKRYHIVKLPSGESSSRLEESCVYAIIGVLPSQL